MFRIEFFVDDKKLGTALIALTGIAHGHPSVQPVINAVKTGNGLAAVTNGKPIERIAHALKQVRKGTALNGTQFRQMLKSVGIAPARSSYFSSECVEAGLIKKTGKTSNVRYVVL